MNGNNGGSARTPRQFHFVRDYRALVRRLMTEYPLDEAMERAVGGQFKTMGAVERQLLVQSGLKPGHAIIDVGCGSGRLAMALASYLTAPDAYLGTDVVPELLAYARARCPATWRFELVEDLKIPAGDGCTDFVVFFSVFTHLLQHESYCYLSEARRVLRSGGRVVFSFLELPHNWKIFEETVKVAQAGKPLQHLNEFMSRQTIKAFARRLDFDVVEIRHGGEPVIQMPYGPARFGQSFAVMQKR